MKTLIKLTIFGLFIFASYGAYSQFNPAKMAVDKANRKAEQKTSQAIDKGLDAATTPPDNNKDKNQDTNKDESKDSDQKAATGDDKAKTDGAQQEAAPMQTYSKFDFVPGEKVVFFSDFTETAVGDFPPNWNTTASGEVVTNNIFPGNWFKMIGEGCVALEEGIKLPENYTIEFDVIPMR